MKWQYSTMFITTAMRAGLATTMNNAGQQGWELVGTVTEEQDVAGQVLILFFKRPA